MKTVFNGLLLLVFLLPTLLFAQTMVSGTVTDQASGFPLPGVNVIVKGTTNGASTDIDGNYTISVNSGDVLVFSYLGYSTKELVYENGQTLNVVLTEDAAQLNEVVVIGYGSVKKEDANRFCRRNILQKILTKELLCLPDQLLQGKAAGVRITKCWRAHQMLRQTLELEGVHLLSGNNSSS